MLHKPSSVPGGRAPHCEIEINGKRLSTLDLFTDKFILFLAPDCKIDIIQSMLPIPKEYSLICYQLYKDFTDVKQDFMSLYQIAKYNAVLVRPDGHIAWRIRIN
ncbi:MAG: hypothetical protein KBD64_06160 [Gammaproteobacteria bacterium]|nr:hypothetical protein [Gammaproteobacteria bacterium]